MGLSICGITSLHNQTICKQNLAQGLCSRLAAQDRDLARDPRNLPKGLSQNVALPLATTKTEAAGPQTPMCQVAKKGLGTRVPPFSHAAGSTDSGHHTCMPVTMDTDPCHEPLKVPETVPEEHTCPGEEDAKEKCVLVGLSLMQPPRPVTTRLKGKPTLQCSGTQIPSRSVCTQVTFRGGGGCGECSLVPHHCPVPLNQEP